MPRNRERYNEYMRRYRRRGDDYQQMLEDPDEYLFVTEPRKRKRRMVATPPWADKHAIREIYRKCAMLNAGSDVKFVVVHDIPISHPNICGLHIPENLRIVTERYAKLKGRKMPKS